MSLHGNRELVEQFRIPEETQVALDFNIASWTPSTLQFVTETLMRIILRETKF
jgi:hypothetical protein